VRSRPTILLLAGVLIAASALLAAPAPAHAAFPGANGKIAFSLYPHIDTMNPDGTGVTAVTQDASVWDREPAWSPDGTKIAFTRRTFGSCFCDRIYTIDADGSNPTERTDGGSDLTPAWSPDGTKIAFARYEAGYPYIWVMNADGSNPTHLAARGLDPAWSPDGTKIAFSRGPLNPTDPGE
jgi:Tol biopolymer transport system component